MPGLSSEAAALLAGRRPRLPKTCAHCGKGFTGVYRIAPDKRVEPSYCSGSCRTKAYNRRKRAEPRGQVIQNVLPPAA